MAEVGGGRETSGADRSRAPQGKNCSSRNVKTAARVPAATAVWHGTRELHDEHVGSLM
jgi:hypothetical protein